MANIKNLFYIVILTTTSGEKFYFTTASEIVAYEGESCMPGVNIMKLSYEILTTNKTISIIDISYHIDNLLLEGAKIEILFPSENQLKKARTIYKGLVLSAFNVNTTIRLTVASIAVCLLGQIGEFFSPICRAELGDNRCKKDLSGLTFTGKIAKIISDRIVSGDHKVHTKDYFRGGIIAFTSGDNKSFRYKITSSEDDRVQFILPFPLPLKIGDEYVIIPGCDKTLDDCVKRYQNAINFRGEPFINQSTKD